MLTLLIYNFVVITLYLITHINYECGQGIQATTNNFCREKIISRKDLATILNSSIFNSWLDWTKYEPHVEITGIYMLYLLCLVMSLEFGPHTSMCVCYICI